MLIIPAAVAAATFTAFTVASASSAPKWYVGGSELKTTETIGGLAEPSDLTVAGVSTKCEHSYYVAKILNSGELGKGEVTNLPLYECSANANCTLAKLEPTKLPWKLHTVYEESKPYLVIEGVAIATEYTGSSCAIKGKAEVTGSIGGLVENSTHKTVFSAASAQATGASLKVGTATVEFTGSYTVEAVGPEHAGQTVEAR
ncbi:MAG TPA: hypothetical protein VGL68_01290 [Solirubrobacteraceae bacterium]|jgi:hypothetical protein